MSYEGCTEWLCENGHLFSCDCWEDRPDDWTCPYCGTDAAWQRSVDQTNGVDPDEEWSLDAIDAHAIREKTPQKTSTCEHCGMRKVIEQPTYEIINETKMRRIPTRIERKIEKL